MDVARRSVAASFAAFASLRFAGTSDQLAAHLGPVAADGLGLKAQRAQHLMIERSEALKHLKAISVKRVRTGQKHLEHNNHVFNRLI